MPQPSRSIFSARCRALGQRTRAELTTREREVLELLATGLSNQEIAARLSLAEKTIKHYMTNILAKLQVRSRLEAALLGQRSGIS